MRLSEILYLAQTEKNVYLYGAGKVGKEMLFYFEHYNIKPTGFIVSDAKGCPQQMFGIHIFELGNIPTCPIESVVIVAMENRNSYKIMDLVSELFFKKVIFMNTKMLVEIEKYNMSHSLSSDYLIGSVDYKIEAKMAIVEDVQGNRLFRLLECFGEESYSVINRYCTIEQFEKEYGKIILYNWCEPDKNYNNIKMYVATSHLDKMKEETIKDYEMPIQVGCALTDYRKGYICDDLGDNISERNIIYSECTGYYWIWKNDCNSEYVGVEHYRRRLRIDRGLPDVDMIVALPQFVGSKVKDFFVPSMIIPTDWQLMLKYVCDYDQEYSEIINQYENNYFYFSCNLCAFRKVLFDDFCKFAFSVCLSIEKYYNERNIVRNDRYMGYIFENLVSLYILKNYNSIKIVCAEVDWIE